MELSTEDSFIAQMADFLYLHVRKTGIHIEKQLFLLFHHKHLNFSLLRGKLRNIFECREVAAQNRRDMFLTNVFEGTEFNTIFNYGATARTTLYLRDGEKVLKDQFIVLSESKYSFPIDCQAIADGSNTFSNRSDASCILTWNI